MNDGTSAFGRQFGGQRPASCGDRAEKHAIHRPAASMLRILPEREGSV
jgi:hypothetical protein